MITKRKVLGKGLDALLPSPSLEGGPQQADTDLLYPNPKQPRLRFGGESLDELAASIRENGIVQPIVVRSRGERYEIVAGERRWRAAQKAGLTQVPIVVMDVPDDKMLELALLENIQREDLNPIEEARAYRLLTESRGSAKRTWPAASARRGPRSPTASGCCSCRIRSCSFWRSAASRRGKPARSSASPTNPCRSGWRR